MGRPHPDVKRMLKGPSKYPIAIDMADQGIYAAQLVDVRQGVAVREMFCRRLDDGKGESPDRTDEWVSAFKEIRKNKRFAGRRVALHLPPQSVFKFPIRFHLNGGETVEEAILRESKAYLPFPMGEAIIDYPALVSPSGGEEDPFRAMIIAVRRDELMKYTSLLKRAGLVVEAVDVPLCSLIRLHKALDRLPQTPVLLCNIGETESMLAIVTNSGILAQRHVPWGTRTLLEKVRAGFGLKDEGRKAEALLTRYGLLYEDRGAWKQEVGAANDATAESVFRAIYQIVSPHIEELVYELHKLIGYVRSAEHNTSLEGMFLYGEANVIRHLDRCLARRFSLPTQVMDPISRMDFLDESILPDRSRGAPFGLALGLAMRRISWL